MEYLEFIKRLILKEHPQFQNTTQRLNTEGWDNLILIMDERVVFRIPRNELIRSQLQVELHYLPQIAAVSSLPVPEYVYLSEEPGFYAGYNLISGQSFRKNIFELCTKSQQKAIAASLGEFLSALHALPFYETAKIKRIIRRQNRQAWLELQTEVLRKADGVLSSLHKQKIHELFAYVLDEIDFDALPTSLIHGDLGSDHIMVDGNRKCISGIIDFGDLMLGDPAYDFTGILLEYGNAFLDEVLAHYSPPLDVKFLERVERFYIPEIPVHHLLYGIKLGDEGIVAQALSDLS